MYIYIDKADLQCYVHKLTDPYVCRYDASIPLPNMFCKDYAS